jgi:SOS-response transcriptional repressor LexA
MARSHNNEYNNVFNFIAYFIMEHGYSPSFREIMKGASISSTSVVTYALKRLEEAERINRVPGIPRSITITSPL